MKVNSKMNKVCNLSSFPKEVEIRYSIPDCHIIHDTKFGKAISFAKRS